jgi:GT2 family glycosyltransferase/2-polyprenyl-3-methyl-5-hydroxy-6-metoxy-1,4-benzoquinol methylase
LRDKYDAKYYEGYLGVDYDDIGLWSGVFGRIADHIVNEINPEYVLDAGCAYGYLVAALRDRGVKAYGIDISTYAINKVREDIKPYCFAWSITDPLPRDMPQRYDLITSIEVLEHLYESDGIKAINNLCKYTDDLIFSSTPDDVVDETHFNVQYQEYWVKLFADNNFFLDQNYNAQFISTQAVRLKKIDGCFSNIIYEYERNKRLFYSSQAQLNRQLYENLLYEHKEVVRSYKYKKHLLMMPMRFLKRIVEAFIRPRFTINYYKNKFQLSKDKNFNVEDYLYENNDLGVHKGNAKRHYILSKLYKKTNVKPQSADDIMAIINGFKQKPLISIVMPVYNVDPKWLKLAIDSVEGQWYKNWELCIADDCSTNQATVSFLKGLDHKKIKIKFLDKNLHISGASNEALKLVKGEYVCLMDHDDELNQDAFYEVVKAINETGAEFIYSDSDIIDSNQKTISIFQKPDYSFDMMNSQNYINHISVIKKSLIDKVGGWEIGLEGSQDHDLYLKVSNVANSIHHIRKVLYHWRAIPGSAASGDKSKNYAVEAGMKSVNSFLNKRGFDVKVTQGYSDGIYRVTYPLLEKPVIDIIIHFNRDLEILTKCLKSILKRTTYENYKIHVIHQRDNFTKDNITLICDKGKEINAYTYQKSKSISSMFNHAVNHHCEGGYIVLLSDDTQINETSWLEQMLMFAQREDVGAVGGKILVMNNIVKYAGGIIDGENIAKSHYLGCNKNDPGKNGELHCVRNCTIVSSEMFMINKDKFIELKGFDEMNVPKTYFDVDLCLRLIGKGYKNVFTPYAEVSHRNIKSKKSIRIKAKVIQREKRYMKKAYKNILNNADAYFNDSFTR